MSECNSQRKRQARPGTMDAKDLVKHYDARQQDFQRVNLRESNLDRVAPILASLFVLALIAVLLACTLFMASVGQ